MQLPAFPHPSTSTWRQTGTPDLRMLKRQGPNAPTNPHPESVIGNQLPPIRNLVPNLWEPGTSKSSQQTASDEGGKESSVHRLRPAGTARGSGSMAANDKRTPRPQPETNHRENGGNQDASRQVNGSGKRPPPSPIEREDHPRTAPSNGVIDFNSWTIGHAHKPSQTSNLTREKTDVRPRSSSDVAKPTGESARCGPQPPHQQEILRDPVGKHWSWLTYRWLTSPTSFYSSIPPYDNS